MRFGETLEATLFPLWKAYYFDYDEFKQTLVQVKEAFPYTQLFQDHQVHIENDSTQPFRFLISKVYFSYKNESGQRVDAVVKVTTDRRSFVLGNHMKTNKPHHHEELEAVPPKRSKTDVPTTHHQASDVGVARKASSSLRKRISNPSTPQHWTAQSSEAGLSTNGTSIINADNHDVDKTSTPVSPEGSEHLQRRSSEVFNELQTNTFNFDTSPISTISVGGTSSPSQPTSPLPEHDGTLRSEKSFHFPSTSYRWIVNEENCKKLDPTVDNFDFKSKEASHSEDGDHETPSSIAHQAGVLQHEAHQFRRRLLRMVGQHSTSAPHHHVTMSFSWDGNEDGYYNPALAYAVFEYQRCISMVIAPRIQAELTKISTFYIKQSHILANAALLCIDSVKLWKDMGPSERSKLRTSYRQTYLMLQVLQQYCDLNTHAITKFLKKLDKNTFQATLDDYATSLEEACFRMGKGSRNIQLQAKLVDYYAKYVFAGQSRKALTFLESGMAEGVAHNRNSMSTIVSLSFLWGLVIAIFAMIIVLLVSLDSNASLVAQAVSWDLIANRYATYLILLPFMFVLLPFLFSINVMVYEYYGINYAYIFELDPVFHFSGLELMRDSLIYILAWLLCVYSYLRINFGEIYCPTDPAEHFEGPTVTPLWCIFPIFIAIYMTIALRNYYSEQHRISMSAATLWAIVTTPMKPVKFRDFFVADQLTSIVIPLFEIQFYWCTFTSATITECVVGRGVNAPFLNILPFVWRMVQSFRRYYDEPPLKRRAFPNLINAFKYLAAVIDVCMWVIFACARYYNASPPLWWTAFGFAFFTSTVSQMYRFAWDVIVDAGIWIQVTQEQPLSDSEEHIDQHGPDSMEHAPQRQEGKQIHYQPTSGQDRPWQWELREDRIYRSWWPYILFFIANLILRWMWIIRYYKSPSYPWAFAMWASLEIFRRFLWNFFRMENEHVSNTENYRATRLAPVPQKDISKWDIDIDENFMADKKIKLDNFTNVTRYFSFLPDTVKARILQNGAYIIGKPVGNALRGQPNEGKSRIFSELPEEVKVLLLVEAVGDETMASFKEKLKGQEPEAQADLVKLVPPIPKTSKPWLMYGKTNTPTKTASDAERRRGSFAANTSLASRRAEANEPISEENGKETLEGEEV